MLFWFSRSFDLGNLAVLEKSPVNIFNNYIFGISLFHWSKCTIECAICLNLISKSAQARCVLENFNFWTTFFLKWCPIFDGLCEQPQPRISKLSLVSLEHFFLTVGQNKIEGDSHNLRLISGHFLTISCHLRPCL